MDKEYKEFCEEITEKNKFSQEEIEEIKKSRKEIWNTFKNKMKKLHPGISIDLVKSSFRHYFNFDPE